MNKQTFAERLRTTILFPFLLPVFFVLHIERYYMGAVPFRDVIELILIYVTGAVVLFYLLRIFIRKALVAGMVTFFLLALFLYWAELLQAVIHTFNCSQNYRNHPFFLLVALLLVISIAILIAKQKEPVTRRITLYMNALLLIYLSVEIAGLVINSLYGKNRNQLIDEVASQKEDRVMPHAGKDIYLLLFDEYASSQSLKNDWQYDNGAIEHFLAARNFHVVRHSKSNYNLTQFSMASLLNMAYLKGYEQPVNKIGERDYQYCIPLLDKPRVVTVLQRAGYRFSGYNIFGIDGQEKPDLNDIHITKRRLVTNNTFYSVLVRHYLPYLTYRKGIKKNPAFYDSAYYRIHTYNRQTLGKVLVKASEKNTHPQFVYAHFLLPHPPYFYDSTGSLLPIKSVDALQSKEDQLAGYRNGVREANRIMQQMIDRIMMGSKGQAIILVLGDHGFRMLSKHNQEQAFPDFNAIYFPDHNYSIIPDSMTNVNLFRIVLNKFCGMHYPLLPDKQCYLKEQ